MKKYLLSGFVFLLVMAMSVGYFGVFAYDPYTSVNLTAAEWKYIYVPIENPAVESVKPLVLNEATGIYGMDVEGEAGYLAPWGQWHPGMNYNTGTSFTASFAGTYTVSAVLYQNAYDLEASNDGTTVLIYKNSFDNPVFSQAITNEKYTLNYDVVLETGDTLYVMCNKNSFDWSDALIFETNLSITVKNGFLIPCSSVNEWKYLYAPIENPTVGSVKPLVLNETTGIYGMDIEGEAGYLAPWGQWHSGMNYNTGASFTAPFDGTFTFDAKIKAHAYSLPDSNDSVSILIYKNTFDTELFRQAMTDQEYKLSYEIELSQGDTVYIMCNKNETVFNDATIFTDNLKVYAVEAPEETEGPVDPPPTGDVRMTYILCTVAAILCMGAVLVIIKIKKAEYNES